MVHIPDRTMFLSVGWNRRITTFPADSDVRIIIIDSRLTTSFSVYEIELHDICVSAFTELCGTL